MSKYFKIGQFQSFLYGRPLKNRLCGQHAAHLSHASHDRWDI